jgi:malate dehydrogenase (quinone)
MIKEYDLVIVGAGVTGSALLYMAARYTDLKRIAIIEKYDSPARVNSLPTHNSQTLHCGDIETNYSLAKALEVQRAATMVRNYAVKHKDDYPIIFKYPKMVIGVGNKECDFLERRYEYFNKHYPDLRLLEEREIAEIEPKVAQGRKDRIVALASTDEYTAVNFEELARSFILEAYKISSEDNDREISFFFGEQVNQIEEMYNKFVVKTDKHYHQTKSIVVCGGGHSLQMAHRMGYGLEYSILPIAGSYYFSPEMLNGKVYTVQNDALPFAAIHGDPDISHPDKTRFGPTAIILPMLERYNIDTVSDFFEVIGRDGSLVKLLRNMFKIKDIRNYMFKNVLFEIPGIRRLLFLREARKIIPTLRYRDLKFAHRIGGIRPQLVDRKEGKLLLGEAKIVTGDGCIFNVTPSPGGTSCMENAETDIRLITKHLGAEFNEELLQNELFDIHRKT